MAHLHALIEHTDVLLEGYAPGTAARLGIDYETLRKIKPDLIYVSISGYGQTGPYRDRPGHDISYQGIAAMLADQVTSPGKTPDIPLADLACAMFAARSVVSALVGRERLHRDTYIKLSLTDCLVALLTPLIVPMKNGVSPIYLARKLRVRDVQVFR